MRGRDSETVVGVVNSRPSEAEELLRRWALEGEAGKGMRPWLANGRHGYEDHVVYGCVVTDDDHG